jgi:multiple sugar transport system permease protein
MTAVQTPTEPVQQQRAAVTTRASKARREGLVGALYALPAGAFVVIFFVLPLLLAFWMSLNNWPLIGQPKFNAPANYEAIGKNQLFLDSIWFTIKYTLVVTTIFLTVSLGLALLVQNTRPGVGFFRTAFLLPTAVGLASASLLFYAMYNNDFGPLGALFRWLGLTEGDPNFLGTPDNAFASTVAMVTWRFAGFNMIILLTGLQAIPLDVYEAARIDGASWFQQLRHITLPLLKPTILLILILSITGSLLAFEPFYVLTAGGPSNSTVTMVITMFREAFSLFSLGKAAAIAMVLLFVLVAINAVQLYAFRDKDPK